MIPTNLAYYRPTTITEALETYFTLKKENKQPVYYGGGTEILTIRRLNLIQTGAFIDIKAIKECNVFDFFQDALISGSALPLTEIEDKNLFPLLSKTAKEIADHTARNKITLGGNLCAGIFYREAVLPFLLTDSQVVVAGRNGVQRDSIHTFFNGTIQFDEDLLLIQLITEKQYMNLPYISIKKRQQWDTGYPLLTIAAIKVDHQLRFAFSGLCPFPFRSEQMERELNNTTLPFEERIDKAMQHIPNPILNDVEGSKEYRLFVLKHTLIDIFLEMEGR